MSETKERKGISVRTITAVMITLSVVIVIAILFLIVQSVKRYETVRENTQIYLICQEAAPDLQAGSDELTTQVRGYAATGDITYLDAYFQEANVTRQRDQAIDVLTPYMEGTQALAYLNAAMDCSMDLMDTEYYAMVLVLNAEGVSPVTYEELRGVELSPEDAALSPDEARARAVDLVFGQEYQSSKHDIESNVNACLKELMDAIEAEMDASYAAFSKILSTLFAMIVLMLVIVLAFVITSLHLVMRPVLQAADYIREQQSLPMRGVSEFRVLARSYNEVIEKTQKRHEDLQHQAEHDALTGLLNRSAYDKLTGELGDEEICLLLIDVDKFKTVNDTYGHDVGDLVLKKAAQTLTSLFRSQDFVFRFGGDEYAVIMNNAGPELRDLVTKKINAANAAMASDAKLPASSMSVGAVFGNGALMEQMFKEADMALYRVKEAGGAGVDFGRNL